MFLGRLVSQLNSVLSVTQVDAAIVGGVVLGLWWWLPAKRPGAPKPGQKERLENMSDRLDALVAGKPMRVFYCSGSTSLF
jgi:hypothetical protein